MKTGKIKVLIVEDELLFAEDLSEKLVGLGFEVTTVVPSGEEALQEIHRLRPEVILMDIKLSGKWDGIETTRRINLEYDIPIIYLSEHVGEETLTRVKQTHPANYLSKTCTVEDVWRALELAFHNSQITLPKRLLIRESGKINKLIDYNDILYLKAAGSYCEIVTANGAYLQSFNMRMILDRLPKNQFIKVHKSFAVNLNQVTGTKTNALLLGDHEVSMSRKGRQLFKQFTKKLTA